MPLTPAFDAHPVAPAPFAASMPRSAILRMAAEVRATPGVADFTVGDFDPTQFPAPPALIEAVAAALRRGHTQYPPAAGIAELRAAVARDAARTMDLDWPASAVVVGSGARPPIYAALMTALAPGDEVVYSTPCWNMPYYTRLARARDVAVHTGPESQFLPTVDQILPHLPTARMLCLNSPSNPAGTAFASDRLAEIAQAVVDENRRRVGRPPLLLLYDQVYRHLVYEGRHVHPAERVPDVAPYLLLVDAISKSWAATGLRVGWALVPPGLAEAMITWIGHVGAWAGRAEQVATAELLDTPGHTEGWLGEHRERLSSRLSALSSGLTALANQGHAVEHLVPRAALYLSARFPGRGDDEAVRRWLLGAGIGIVPFSAFGQPEGSGWVRFSVGATSPDAIDGALSRLAGVLADGDRPR